MCSTNLAFDVVPEVLANGNQIQQVLLNLLINARQAMGSGGQITIKLSFDAANEMVDLMVRDTGCGISPADHERIFSTFTQADSSTTRRHGGSGLGLAICKRIAENHMGYITARGNQDKGAEFHIYLPFDN